jgi:glycosyltransferase involved in cell wall biosynthesis
MFDSQTARWVGQLARTGWDLHIFDRQNLIHPQLKNVTVHTGWKKSDVPSGTTVRCRWPFLRGRHLMEQRFPRIWEAIVPDAGRMLAECISRVKPDCIHALGSNPYAYSLMEAGRLLGGQLPVPWIYSCKGNDLYDWGRLPEHRTRLQELLEACDYYICNCERDVRLARDLGFRGEFLGLFQGAGGYPVGTMQELRAAGPTSQRRVIALKGLQGRWGRALTALEGLRQCADLLDEYQISVYQAHPETRKAVAHMVDSTDVHIEVMPRVHWEEVWKLFGRARLALGVNATDGVPNAMIEAMIMGAFPIQTNPGGATAEWIEDGVNGSMVPHDDPEAVAEAIRNDIQNDAVVDGAAEINLEMAKTRVDEAFVQPRVIRLYRRVVQVSMRDRQESRRR